MRNTAREPRKNQQGFTLLMVLIVLATGSLAIPATLNYVGTGARAAKASEAHLLRQYAGDAAVQQSLWRLAHNVDGIVDDLRLETPSKSFTTAVNGIEVPYTIEIALFKDAESEESSELPPFPPVESGNHIESLLNVTPKWLPCGEEYTLFYDIYNRNYGTSNVGFRQLAHGLPPGASYQEGSYTGPSAAFTQTWVTDHWELLWDFENPRPRISSGGTLLISFRITITVGLGSYDDFGEGWIYYQASGQEEIQLNYGGTEDPIAVGLYDITVTAGNSRVRANTSVCDSVVNVKSYQVD